MKHYHTPMAHSFAPISPCLAITIILLFGASGSLAQRNASPLHFSDRIGERLDRLTRDYFGILPGVDGFSSAVITGHDDTTVAFIVARRRNGDTTVVMPRGTFAQLRLYVDHFEGLFADDTTTIDWQALNGFVLPVNPFINKPLELVIRSRSGEEVTGFVLYADSSAIVLGASWDQRIDGGRSAAAQVLAPSDIALVRDTRGFGGHFFSEIDIPIEGNDTIFRREILPIVRHRMRYAPLPPPEIISAIKAASHAGRFSAPMTVAELEELNPPRRLHIGVFYGTIGNQSSTEYTIETYNAPQKTNGVQGPAPTIWGASLDYSLARRFSIGIGFVGQSAGAQIDDSLFDYERYKGSLGEATAKFVMIPSGRYLTDPISRFQISLGVGVAIQWLEIEQRVKSPYSQKGNTFNDRRTIIGAVGTFGLGYYLRPNLSIDFEGRVTTLPEQEVPGHEFMSLGGSPIVLRSHSKYRISTATSNLLFGVRIHI